MNTKLQRAMERFIINKRRRFDVNFDRFHFDSFSSTLVLRIFKGLKSWEATLFSQIFCLMCKIKWRQILVKLRSLGFLYKWNIFLEQIDWRPASLRVTWSKHTQRHLYSSKALQVHFQWIWSKVSWKRRSKNYWNEKYD